MAKSSIKAVFLGCSLLGSCLVVPLAPAREAQTQRKMAKPEMLAQKQGRPLGIAVDKEAVYWTTQEFRVMRLGKKDRKLLPLTPESELEDKPKFLLSDAEAVYWSDSLVQLHFHLDVVLPIPAGAHAAPPHSAHPEG